MSMSSAASTTVIPDGHSAQLFGVADARSQRTAKLQGLGLPWPCPHHKIQVTNSKCREMKIAGDTRQCSDCGLPLALGIVTREELKMAKFKHTCPDCGEGCNALFGPLKLCWACHDGKREEAGRARTKAVVKKEKAKDAAHTCLPLDNQGRRIAHASKQAVVGNPMVDMQDVQEQAEKVTGSEDHFADPGKMVSGELSWDDFQDIAPYRQPEQFTVSIRAGEYLTFSVGVIRTLGWKSGEGAVVRRDALGKSLAFRNVGPHVKKQNLKITEGSNKSAALRVCCSQALNEVAAKTGTYEVTVTPWGVIVHLDRPAQAKA